MKYMYQKPIVMKIVAIVFLASFIFSVLPLPQVEAAIWNPGGETHPYLSPKWTASVSGGGEALLTADVRSDIPGEEVFHAGGPVQPSSTAGSVRCLNGQTGNQIWRTNIYGVGDTATMQMADVDNDGRLEILVALQHPSGLYILNAEDGTLLWCAPGTYNGHLGYFRMVSSTQVLGGRIDGSGVVGDTDGDGYKDIFIGIMAYETQPTTGAIIHLEWNGSTIVELGRTQVWHPCAGGLSMGDTDNDGIPELYMNERDVYFGDGSWGRGTTSFTVWDGTNDVFIKRWSIYDWGASSDIPMLADVNKDGIVDVVSTNLGRGIMVLNSSDGQPLKNTAGTTLKATNLGTHAHYQASIYDIDGDGNLELLCADGKESESYGTQVFDLWSWTLDADIPAGYSFRGPSLGEVTGDGEMDIIIVTFDLLGNTHTGTVQIYDKNYQLMDTFGGEVINGVSYLRHRAIGSVVQDIDRNDNGLNELLVLTQGGTIYCFDTPGLSQEYLGKQRARSEVHFFSESRLGAAEYVPFERPWSDIISTNPAPNAVGVPIGITSLSFTLNHPLGEQMDYVVTSDQDIISGSGSATNVGNGIKTVAVDGPLAEATTYSWTVTVTDDSGHVTNKNYWFTTGPYSPNSPPVTVPSITAGNTILDDLTASYTSTSDPDSNPVTNIYNWQKGSVSIANINLPFETQTSSQNAFSGLATTKDYAYGATGTVFGATWVPNGKVGGAYSFDGNDFIRIPEPTTTSTRTRYDGYGTWTAMSVETWVKVASSSSERLIVKTDLYDVTLPGEDNTTSPQISYRLDCSNSGSALSFTWRVGVGPTNTITEVQPIYILGPYSVATDPSGWHHVVVTYKSGTGLRLYVDGVQIGSLLGPTYTGNVFNTNGPFEIAFGSGSDFRGLVDEVRLYPYEISPSMVNQRYLDTKDGLSSSSTISKYDTNIGEVWRCQITPNDDLVDGTTSTTNTITIVDTPNLPPSVSNLAITPASPLTADDLAPTYTYSDPEGHPEVGSIVNWYKGGVFNFSNPILPASLTTKGDVWSYRITPSDGFEYGIEVISGTVTIGSTAPSFTGGLISPDPAFDSSTLTASSSGWTDADGDTPGYHYQWQIKIGDIYTDISGMTSQTLTTVYFSPNDWIAVKVTAFDGVSYGNTITFETLIIDSDPPSTGTPILTGLRDDDELTCTPVNTVDPDGDSVINIFNWLTGSGSGTSITNLYLPFETHSSTSATDYSGYGNNGVVTGATWTSEGRIGHAYSFDGNDVVTVADSTSLGSDGTWNKLTVEYWVKPLVDQGRTVILNKNGGSASTMGKYMTGFMRAQGGTPNNVIFFGVYTAISEYEEPSFSQTYDNIATRIPTGSWSHIVGTYEAGFGLKLYINGVLASELSGVTGNIVASEGEEPLLIGYSSPIAGTSNRYFKGSLDEIRIYPNILSAAQVFQNYVDQKDGLSNHVTIVPQETSSGQVWRCAVTPNDGWQDGVTKTSNQLTITSTNTKPHIDWYSPAEAEIHVNIGDSVDLQQISSDPNDNSLTYSWTLDGGPQSSGQNWTYTPLSASEHIVRVTVSDGSNFDYQEWTVDVGIPVEQYTLTVNVDGIGCSVISDPSGTLFNSGTVVQLTPVPAAGYSFSSWSGDLSGNDNPASITMDSDKSVTATFSQDEYILAVALDGSGTVDVSPLQGTYHYGDTVTLTADADLGWWFVGWSGDATGTVNPKQITIVGDTSVTATFSDKYQLTVNVVGNGQVNLSPLGGLYTAGTVVDLTAVAELGYTFTEWSGDLTGSTNPESITMNEHKTVTATFTQDQYTLTVTVAGTGCSVTKMPNTDTYTYGTEVDLTAVEAPGYTFSVWSGDASGTGLMTSVTMNGNRAVTATFTQDEYVLTIITIGSGSVSKNPDQTTYNYGESVTLTADPAEGWIFSSWSGDLSGSVNPDAIVMNGDRTVTATFTEQSAHLFEDGFESGNFALWDGQDTGASISTLNPYEGAYHLRSSLTSGANNGWRGIYKSISGTNPVYLGANVDFNAPPNTDSEDQWVLAFTQSTTGNALAYGGIRQVSGTNYWAIWYISTGTTLTYQVSNIAYVDGWHDLELAIYRGTANNGWIEFRVDGVLVCSAYNLDNDGRTLSYARVGFSYSDAPSAASATVDIDYVTIDSNVAPPTLYDIGLLSSGASTNNLGTIRLDNTDYVLPGTALKVANSYSISFTPDASYVFDHWVVTGSVSVASSTTPSTTLTVSGDGTLEAIYTSQKYTLHVSVTGSGTTDHTGDTQYDAGTNVQVLATAGSGNQLDHWVLDTVNVGSANPYAVTMDGNHDLTAVFAPIPVQYTLEVIIVGSGSVNKSPDQATYDVGSLVELTPVSAAGYSFSGWSGDLSGSDNPATITMDGDKTVTATFTENPVEHLLEDDFESGNLDLWDGQGGSLVVSNAHPFQGTYHLRCTLSSGANNAWSGIYESISGTNPVYLSADVYFNAPPNTDSEDQWVLAFTQNTAGDALAYAGVRQVSGTNYWSIWYYSGTTLTYQVSDSAYTSGWHSLQLAIFRGTSSNGWVEFYVDGILTCSAYNLDNDGRTLSYARVGFSYSDAPSTASATVDIDNVTIDN